MAPESGRNFSSLSCWEPPDSWGPIGSMNCENWRTTVLTLATHLPFTFRWLLGDAKWAMGIARSSHGNEWGEFYRRSGGPRGQPRG